MLIQIFSSSQAILPSALDSKEISKVQSLEFRIKADWTIEVTELIRAFSDNQQLKHGIIKDFPNTYTDEFSKSSNLHLKFNWAKRNNIEIPFSAGQAQENHTTYYLGDLNIEIESGWHEFMFNYTINQRIATEGELARLSWEFDSDYQIQFENTVIEIKLPAFVEKESIYYAARIVPAGQATTSEPAKPGQLGTGLISQIFDASLADPTAKDINGVRFKVTRPLTPYEKLVFTVWWPAAFMKLQ